MASDEDERLSEVDGADAPDELTRMTAELREANKRLVIAGLQMQELVDQAEMARALAETARTAAEASSHAKDEFLAALSHELRTPLNAILGWTYMLRRGTVRKRSEHAVETIERNAKLLGQLVADLLQVSQIISGRLQLDAHALDLAPLIAASMDTVRPAATAKDIAFTANIADVGPVQADPSRVHQILWNLLSNAIKFTPHGGRVQIGLARVGAHAQVTVADSGVGIEPAFLPQMFDRFRQEESSYTRTFGGLGLGLAIVRQLVELHGGAVTAHSAGKGLGSIFTVTLPLLSRATFADASDEQPGTAAPSLQGLRLLVVEDDVDSRELLSLLLREAGATVIPAASAGEAMSLLEAVTPHVIVADMGLRGEEGYTLLHQLRASRAVGGRATVPSLALIGTESDEGVRALASGYLMHLPKPIDPAAFIAGVSALALQTERGSGLFEPESERRVMARMDSSDVAPPRRSSVRGGGRSSSVSRKKKSVPAKSKRSR